DLQRIAFGYRDIEYFFLCAVYIFLPYPSSLSVTGSGKSTATRMIAMSHQNPLTNRDADEPKKSQTIGLS
ncbi:MAG: hypothetical protein WCR76_00860, partial [Sphaerochaetaceae bacterium]